MGFSRQEYWSGLPFPSPGDLPDSGIKPWSPALQADALTSEPPGKPHFPQFALIYVHCEANHLFLCLSLLLLLQSLPASGSCPMTHLFAFMWPKYWSFSFNNSPSSECSGLISFRIDFRLYLLAVQGTLKSLFQHHNSKASILHCSVLFMVQFSSMYMTTRKAIASSIWTFVSKVISLLFNMLSRLSIAFLPRSKHLLIS